MNALLHRAILAANVLEKYQMDTNDDTDSSTYSDPTLPPYVSPQKREPKYRNDARITKKGKGKSAH